MVGKCKAFETVPPFPQPNSDKTFKSSFLKSNLNSTPNSKPPKLSLLSLLVLVVLDEVVEVEAVFGVVGSSNKEVAEEGGELLEVVALEEPVTCIGLLSREAAEVPERVPGLADSEPSNNPFLLRFFFFDDSKEPTPPPPSGSGKGDGSEFIERRELSSC